MAASSSPSRPPLAPISLERPSLIVRFLREQYDVRLPDWATVLAEAETLRHELQRGVMTWPPEEVGGPGIYLDAPERSLRRTVNPEHRLVFGTLPSMVDVMSALMRSADDWPERESAGTALVGETVEYLHGLLQWRHYGRQVYVVDPETYQLLARTDLPDIPATFLRPPYPAFYVVLPPGLRVGSDAELETIRPAEGALVLTSGSDGGDWVDRQMEIQVYARQQGTSGLDATPANTTLMALPPDRSIREAAAIPEFEEHDPDRGLSELDPIPKVMIGLCLYLQSEHPYLEPVPPAPRLPVAGIKNPAKRRRAEEKNARVSALGYVYVGRPEPTSPASITGEGQRETPAARRWRLQHQIWVRGHWRLQAVGPGRRERRLTWVRPFLKGPDMGEALGAHMAKVQPARERSEAASLGDAGPEGGDAPRE